VTIYQALEKLIDSEQFKIDARKDSSLRVFTLRFKKGEIKNGAAVEMLIRYGYTIHVKKQNNA
jgi:hypothetical protein